MDPVRRKLLKTGAAAALMSAAPNLFSQQNSQSGSAGAFYENGAVIKLKKWDGSGHLLQGQGHATI